MTGVSSGTTLLLGDADPALYAAPLDRGTLVPVDCGALVRGTASPPLSLPRGPGTSRVFKAAGLAKLRSED